MKPLAMDADTHDCISSDKLVWGWDGGREGGDVIHAEESGGLERSEVSAVHRVLNAHKYTRNRIREEMVPNSTLFNLIHQSPLFVSVQKKQASRRGKIFADVDLFT